MFYDGLRALCTRPMPDDHGEGCPWLMTIAERAAVANREIRDRAVEAYDNGRSVGTIGYQLALMAAVNACANAGASLIRPRAVPFTIADADSYGLACNALGRILDAEDRVMSGEMKDPHETELDILADGVPEPERLKAELRELLVEQHMRTGRELPEWLAIAGGPLRTTVSYDEVDAETDAAAFKALTKGHAGVERKIRAILVEEFRAAKLPLPEWLKGPAAREFLDEL